MYNTLLSIFRSIICQLVAYGRLKQRKISNFSSKSGRSRLQEIVTQKRFQKYSDLAWKLLICWKTGRRGDVVTTGGLTVNYAKHPF